jgi:hypothetical protein
VRFITTKNNTVTEEWVREHSDDGDPLIASDCRQTLSDGLAETVPITVR